MKKRSLFWDNYKGILILLVVFGHFIHGYSKNLPDSLSHDIYVFVYSFHMPAFIFCSGYFSKSEHARSTQALIQLALYYVVFNSLMALFEYLYVGTAIKFLTPYYSFWYILSLIIWRAAIGKLQHIKGLLVFTILIALVVGYCKEFSNILSIRRTIAFFPFFVAGYLLDKEKVEGFFSRKKELPLLLYTILAIVIAVCAYWVIRHFDLNNSITLMSSYSKNATIFHRMLIFVIASTAICCMFFVVPNYEVPLLSRIGRNSLLVYLAHRFITLIYYRDIFPSKTYSNWYLVFALIATIVTCLIFSGDKLNLAVSNAFSKAASAISDTNSILGKRLLTVMLLLFLLFLLLAAGPQIISFITGLRG